MILNVEHKLNSGHLGISRVQQPERFLIFDTPPGSV